MTESQSCTRRAVLAAGGAGTLAALTGCSTYGDTTTSSDGAAPPAATSGPPLPTQGGPVPSTDDDPAAPAGSNPPPTQTLPPRGLASVRDIPVGGGKIFSNEKVVITQPTAGTIKAFSAVCTHAGCTVNEVRGGTINCPCHGSSFKVRDGSVAGGPAPSPLPPLKVKVAGDQISLA